MTDQEITMMYVKCFFAGLGVLVVISLVYMYAYFIFVARPTLPRVPLGTGVGIDARVFFRQPLFWVIALIAFAAGFYWKFQRATG